jgi:iron complex outermembrane recepter protein
MPTRFKPERSHLYRGFLVKKAHLSKLHYASAPLVLALALISTPSFAQSADPVDETAEEAAPIVVTGSRIVSPNLTAVSPVTAISAQDIKLSGTGNTEDILNSLPQVFAAQSSTISNGASGTATVDLRGLGTSRTLVLINGRRLMTGDPNSTTSAADLNFIPASLIKRVDVLTGGASATYGADAVAGVVNFIMDKEFSGFRIDANYSFYNHKNRNGTTPSILKARQAQGFAGYGFPENSTTNDGADFDATVSFGGKFNDDRGHFMAYAGYRKAKPVLQSNRDYSACTIQLTGAALAATVVPPILPRRLNPAAPLQCGGSATSATGNALLFPPSTSSSTFGALGPGTLTVGAGPTRYNFAPLNYFQRPDERYTAGAFVDYEVSPAIKPYLEFMFMDDRTIAQIAPSGDFGNTLTINCDNPLLSASQSSQICQSNNLINGFIGTFPTATGAGYNPNPGDPAVNFIDPFDGHTYNKAFFQLLRRNVEGGPRINDLTHTAFRTVLGSKGELGKAWNYDAYYQYGRTNYAQVYSNEFSVDRLNKALDVVDDPRVAGVQAICRSALAGTDPNCKPYDVFGGTPSAASLAYLSATGFLKGNTAQQIFSATFSGDLGEYGMKMPWASNGISVALGAEHRKESLELLADNAFQTGDLTGQGAPTLPVSGSYNVSELLGEIEVPIVQDSFFHNLSFNGAYRYSSYKVSNGRKFNSNTYKLGLDFTPIKDIRFRAAYNRAVRAPNIQELFAAQFVGLDGSNDPCTGGPIAATNYGCLAQGLSVGQTVTGNPAGQYNGLLGGNQNLRPERATTKTFGVVLQPSFLPGFSLSVDWFDIQLKDAIQGFGADAILTACAASTSTTIAPACALVKRDAAGSLWLTSNGYVIDTPTNVGGLGTRGLEFNGAYSRKIGEAGTLSLSMVGTLLDKYNTDNGLTAEYDCAGLFGPTCGGPAPKWRHKARATFNAENGLGVSLQWRYFGSVDAEYTSSSATLTGPSYDFNRHVKSQSYFDLSFSAKFADHFKWTLGANNLLDREPPLFHSGSGAFGQSNCSSTVCNGNTYPGTYDALGRYLYTGITLDF